MIIKNYSYSLNGDDLTIFVEDMNGNEFSLATISGCKGYNNTKCMELCEEIIDEMGYELLCF